MATICASGKSEPECSVYIGWQRPDHSATGSSLPFSAAHKYGSGLRSLAEERSFRLLIGKGLPSGRTHWNMNRHEPTND